MLPNSTRGRLRWALSESVVVAGILFAWIVVALVVTVAFRVLTLPFRLLDVPLPLSEVLLSVSVLGNAILVVTLVTSLLYVLVRAGTLILDYRREP
ncbi:hypothetical protein [Natrarchaeobaculum sulfurireducens]|uniref:Uncharacterized protein n=1 Tax=Natrarchaeobaculum sulfurireducens TaxID=2044521 RepID=A0A346PRM3_9EURY|nr:hypothetical protein [Natrarchaeobaculum sulfurireducens]AXR82168.1 hypothetical protein AArcMg_2170 [Natrarchaeobaculum sulfurireducens]